MRADMGKVLVERPRLGRWRGASRPVKGYRGRLKKCLDAGDPPPQYEGIKRRYGAGTKSFNEHLGPLRRFLDANVGRPWDKVYSEICQHVDRGNVVQKHILTHLFEYVTVHTVLIDGLPSRGKAHWGARYGAPVRTSDRRDRWYVCPKSGLLRKSKYVPRASRRPATPRTVRLNNKQVCVCRGDRWELISVAMIAHPYPQDVPAYDAILQRYIDAKSQRGTDQVVEYHGRIGYAVTRRVLSRKDLLGLPIPIDWLK
ncbi:hypothetical protein [Frigoriglobus tundricola]|uniref:Transposase n=1 Tax=Frigoriglobus tundricola TaxID=2774151 RepID=A0A6M5YHU5_9BACT|nr:hypothetical protein [Frigoriglobus tundricola]QJW93625.1 hypothetical protein FTUN_1133 [Frigoriglobus tundricola]